MFDLAFVDGDKRTYIETYEMVMGILNPGGYMFPECDAGDAGDGYPGAGEEDTA